MKTMTIEHDQRAIASKIGYAIMGFVYAVAAYQVPATIVALVINSTGDTDLTRLSILIQITVGLLLGVVAYRTVSNHSLKFGMRVCYGLVVGILFAIGIVTILMSL